MSKALFEFLRLVLFLFSNLSQVHVFGYFFFFQMSKAVYERDVLAKDPVFTKRFLFYCSDWLLLHHFCKFDLGFIFFEFGFYLITICFLIYFKIEDFSSFFLINFDLCILDLQS